MAGCRTSTGRKHFTTWRTLQPNAITGRRCAPNKTREVSPIKVLYVSVYRDHTGYGQAAIDYVLALDAAGVDVVCRPLKLNGRQLPLPQRILELEAKSFSGADVVIQHMLPHQMDFNGRFKKNIGLFASETSHFRDSVWAERLNVMDEVWVINNQQVQACRASGVTKPIRVVPHATDVTRFERSYAPLESLRPHKDRGEFLFYTIGEFVRRKNYAALLKAFHTEFDPSEPVRLVMKTDRSGMPDHELQNHITAFCNEIKRGLKIRGGKPEAFKDELVFLERFTPEAVSRLHSTCDCYVGPSYGEAWGIPAFDAMAFGKTPIATNWGGLADYLTNQEGWPVRWHEEPVFGITDSFEDLYTGNETWAAIDVLHLRRCMREAYEQDKVRTDKAIKGIEKAFTYSYERVGALMKGLLYDDRNFVATAQGPVFGGNSA